MRYAVIGPGGVILQTGTVQDPETLALQGGDLLAVEVPPGVHEATHYFDGAGFTAYPPRPGERFSWDGTAWTDPRSLAEVVAHVEGARAGAIAAINACAADVRRRYVTDILGQEAIYMMKEAEARAWVASGGEDPAQFPLILAEVGITAPTAHEVAQVYLNLAGLYVQVAARLETARLGCIAAAETAIDEDAARAAVATFQLLIEEGAP